MAKKEQSYAYEWALLHGVINTTALRKAKLNLKKKPIRKIRIKGELNTKKMVKM